MTRRTRDGGEERRRGEGGEGTDIKSNNPHLTGGEVVIGVKKLLRLKI